jgi:Domain of unknown function (DUF222)
LILLGFVSHPHGTIEQMFESLGLEIKHEAAVEVGSIDDASLDAGVAPLARLRNQLDALEASRLAAWDRRKLWALSGAKSAAAELAHRTRQPIAECRARLAVARAMARLPVAAEAWLAGDITGEHVRVLARACNPRSEPFMARDEAVLVDQAKRYRFDKWVKAVAYWSEHADPDGTSENELARNERRHLSLQPTPRGWALAGFLAPVGGETVANELRRLEQQLFDADWAKAKTVLGRDPLANELERTSAQRRADALVEMAARSAGSHTQAKPLFTVLLGPDVLGSLCELETSGRVVSPSALRDWIDDALLETILFEAGEREVRVSRKRRFTGALRRLIEVRDRECYHPTCDVTAPHCQGDHIEPHAAGGLTSPDNGRLACGHHNRLRHRRPPPPDPPPD